MYQVKDTEYRRVDLPCGIVLQACGADENGKVCAVDVILHGKLIYCLPINDEKNPYCEALARIFDALTQ